MFFWIIVLSFLIPVAMRLYRRSVRGRNQGTPGQFGGFPVRNRDNPGNQGNQPRDGYTQQDYFGGFGQLGAPKQQGLGNQPTPTRSTPTRSTPTSRSRLSRTPVSSIQVRPATSPRSPTRTAPST